MTNEVKLLPCPFCEGAPEAKENVPGTWALGVAIACSSSGCGARQCGPNADEAAARWNTRPTIVTDEVVELRNVLERVDDFIVNELAGEQPTMDYCQANPEAGEILLAVRTALAAMPAMVGGEGWGEKRVCSVCTAVISQYPEGMCCHCQEMPWPLAQPDTPHD